jgi:hypothetical protein
MQGWTMAVPAGWNDKSMLIASAAEAGKTGVVANLVVTFDRFPTDLPQAPAKRMEAFVARQLGDMREKLARFSEISRVIETSGNPIYADLSVSWSTTQAMIGQWLRFIDDGTGGLVIATGTAGLDDIAAVRPRFEQMLASLERKR